MSILNLREILLLVDDVMMNELVCERIYRQKIKL